MRSSLPLNNPLAATCMPESWARASMLIRLNSLAGRASGIRADIAESLVSLLNKDVMPRIPVRGSISASGDLSALAWIGALMQGKTSATAFSGPRDVEGARRVTRADVALSEAGIAPISLHAKEGLAIVNGTAVSAGVAALAAHESLHLAALSQVLTAMSVEALRGSDESFEPFIAQVRPHPSRNMATLRQDRYSLRTATQWIGPVLEDFGLARHGDGPRAPRRQLSGARRNIGGREATLGPPEYRPHALHPVHRDDQPGYQLGPAAKPMLRRRQRLVPALNSLALVSARYTLEAVDVLSQIASAHLLALCQALDLRIIDIEGRNDDAPPDATPYIG
ncbi:hypothetical protein N7486_006892 [Penicillium sp. IBT 16267x]|nr:hypothetical protein N7486_006892 [Penicillium sp. IBT 16267x]